MAMKKRVYIVGEHHNVLREWCKYQGQGMHLLSFDYHIDFRPFSSGIGSDPLKCENVEAAIIALAKNEHIDYAIRRGIIKKAFVFSYERYFGGGKVRVKLVPDSKAEEYAQAKIDDCFKRMGLPQECLRVALCRNVNNRQDGQIIIESQIVSFSKERHPLAPVSDKLITSDDVLNSVLGEFNDNNFDWGIYIFDFDCDFIRDEEAMTHEHFETLKKIIRGAKVITIAREPDCCDSNVPFQRVERWLTELVENCGDKVEIEYDTFAGSH